MEAYDQPKIIYPVGKHIGIRNLITNQMSFIRQPEYVREIMGLYISTGNSRKNLAVVEKHVRDNSTYVSFYDKISSGQPKCTLNFTEIMYGQSKNRD